MAQYSHFRRTGTNLKTAGISPQVAWYRFAMMEVRNVAKLQVTSVFCDTYSLGVLLTSLHPNTHLSGAAASAHHTLPHSSVLRSLHPLRRLIHGYLLLKIWLKSRLSHVYGIYVIVNELRFPCCFDLILVRMD